MNKHEIASVVLPIAVDREFDYLVPEGTGVGSRLLVDFRGKKMVGILTGIKKESKIEKIKPAIDVLDNAPILSRENIHFAKQLSEHYPYSLAEFIFMMLPARMKLPKKTIFSLSNENEKHGISKKIFIKAPNFLERYNEWKGIVKEKIKHGSVVIILPQLSYLNEAKKIIEKDFPELKIIHSYENDKELFANWASTRTKSIILGTRVALFYYPSDIRLLVVEEENSQYYFQEEKPYYHLVDVAFLLSEDKKIDAIFSANYPSLYSYNLIKKKKIELLEENTEKEKEIKIISIGEYRRQLLSPVLVDIIGKNIEQNLTSVILWNKTGFGSFLACSACGYIFKCESCSAFLKLSVVKNKGICPYCGRERDLSKICNLCNSGYIRSSGLGIERIELLLKRIFPDVEVSEWGRNDQNARIVLATSKILSSLYNNEKFDSGFLLDADYLMSRFDYDATFDTYLYIKNLSSLFKNNFYIFTRNKEHYLFKTLNEEWKNFYEKELTVRRELNIPPFASIAKITLRALDQDKLLVQANQLFTQLKSKDFDVYGPLKEQPFKLRGKYRYSVIIKSKDSYLLRKTIKEAIQGVRSSSLKVAAIIK